MTVCFLFNTRYTKKRLILLREPRFFQYVCTLYKYIHHSKKDIAAYSVVYLQILNRNFQNVVKGLLRPLLDTEQSQSCAEKRMLSRRFLSREQGEKQEPGYFSP